MSRILRTPALRQFSTFRAWQQVAETSAPIVQPAAPIVKVKKPMGAFRGGFFGFLLGSTAAFVASFTYLRTEWKTRDELMMEDFASLRATCLRVETRFRQLEEKLATIEKAKK